MGVSGGYLALGREAVDTISFDYVFTAYYPYVSKLARSLLGNVQDAEDVTQEVFLRVHKHLDLYDPERGGMTTWLGKMTVNACNTHRRRNFFSLLWKSAVSDGDDDYMQELLDPSILGSPEEYALQGELRKAVRSVLSKLRPQHRIVLILHYYMDLSCPEIASILECPEGTVYSRLHHARRNVQSQLERQVQSPGSEAGIWQ